MKANVQRLVHKKLAGGGRKHVLDVRGDAMGVNAIDTYEWARLNVLEVEGQSYGFELGSCRRRCLGTVRIRAEARQ
jgi:hypothetical protein